MPEAQADGVSFAACAACVAAIVLFQFLVSARPSSPHGAAAAPTAGAQRQDLHVQRKLQHAGTGGLIYAASSVFSRSAGAGVLLAFALVFLGVHELRKRSDRVDAAYVATFRSILRQDEVNRTVLPGAFYFLLGSGTALALFPPRIARLAVLHLAVGDPTAAFVGTLYGRHKLSALIGDLGGSKSLEGSAGCFAIAAVATFTALTLESAFYFSGEAHTATTAIALAGGLCAAAAELLDVAGWDDNLSLPLLSGVFLQLSVGRWLL
ncbi:hypothetical protein BBJ28_00018623 [Nothophytophthora sp. Chile5]|nr:hypothetical protein BBJ28_00018623 [Nothophytophthora sp. Chile5]